MAQNTTMWSECAENEILNGRLDETAVVVTEHPQFARIGTIQHVVAMLQIVMVWHKKPFD